MQTIVVGYDGTEASARALERAAGIAKAFGSSIVVTSVAGVLTGASRGGGSVDPTDAPEEHEALLEEARTKLSDSGLEVSVVLGIGHPADAIVQLAEERGADLVVVGTREPGFWERMLGNSVSASVQRQARCDVLIVH